jgi:RND family efflux transporter MFP subunit
MGTVRWGLVALMAIAAVSAWTWYGVQSGVVVSEARYHCPMHPQIVSAQKGECPICGMDLVPTRGGDPGDPHARAAAATATSTTATQGAGDTSPPLYTCPMHPAFVTADANARCPECGMKLVAKARPTRATAGAGARGVPGLEAVQLDAHRIQLAGIRTAPVRRGRLSPELRTTGFVTASEDGLVSVTARVTGWIETVAAAQTGQPVRKGEVLATVYSPDLLNAQRAYLNAARWSDRAPASTSAATPAIGDLQRDARIRLQQLGVSAQDLEAIAKTGPQPAVNIRSPVRGHVVRRGAVPGAYVTPGMELFQIADLSTVWVLADVPEADLARVSVGQHASFETAAYPEEPIHGVVRFIYPALNPTTRTLQARIEVANPRLKLRPGMFGQATLDLGGSEALVVPRDAIVDTGELQYVFVAKGGGRLEPRRVRASGSSGDEVAVLDGLAEGEQVVTAASFLVDSESRLRAAVQGFDDSPGAGAPAR